MGKSGNSLGYFFICLIIGGSIAAIGVMQLKPMINNNNARASRSNMPMPSNPESIVKILHGDTDIEKAAMDPAYVAQFKDHRDKLSSDDKSAMKKLIEKVTE